MKSFTLPTGQKKDQGISLGRSVYMNDKGNNQSWKQRSNIFHSSRSAGQLKMEEVCSSQIDIWDTISEINLISNIMH